MLILMNFQRDLWPCMILSMDWMTNNDDDGEEQEVIYAFIDSVT